MWHILAHFGLLVERCPQSHILAVVRVCPHRSTLNPAVCIVGWIWNTSMQGRLCSTLSYCNHFPACTNLFLFFFFCSFFSVLFFLLLRFSSSLEEIISALKGFQVVVNLGTNHFSVTSKTPAFNTPHHDLISIQVKQCTMTVTNLEGIKYMGASGASTAVQYFGESILGDYCPYDTTFANVGVQLLYCTYWKKRNYYHSVTSDNTSFPRSPMKIVSAVLKAESKCPDKTAHEYFSSFSEYFTTNAVNMWHESQACHAIQHQLRAPSSNPVHVVLPVTVLGLWRRSYMRPREYDMFGVSVTHL